jgi:hypothetical protein
MIRATNKSNNALYNVKQGSQIVKEIENIANDRNNEVGRKKNTKKKTSNDILFALSLLEAESYF